MIIADLGWKMPTWGRFFFREREVFDAVELADR